MQTDPYSLDNLKDIIEPSQVSFWPPATGGWLLLALLILWAVVLGVIWGIRWRRNAYRRAALGQFAGLKTQVKCLETRGAALQQIPALLKRTAMAAYTREQVGSLTGDKWLVFLDRTSGTRAFSEGAGRLLPVIPYVGSDRLKALTDAQVTQLMEISESWIKKHRRRDVPSDEVISGQGRGKSKTDS